MKILLLEGLAPLMHELYLTNCTKGLSIVNVLFAGPFFCCRNAGNLCSGRNKNNLFSLLDKICTLSSKFFHKLGVLSSVFFCKSVGTDFYNYFASLFKAFVYFTHFVFPLFIEVCGSFDRLNHRIYLICPSPSIKYLVVVKTLIPIGPRACSFWVEIPSSAPKPNSPPSVKRVLAFT